MTQITKKELETPRTADQIKSWVDKKLGELSKSDKGKRAVRFRKGHLKELIEETLPLGIFCDHHFNNDPSVSLQQIIGNQNHDVVVTDSRYDPGSLKFIEITQAHEGENAHLRMLKLDKEGHANAFGPITKTGTKNTNRKIEIEEIAVEHGEIVDNEISRIHEAATRKASKKYPEGTGLVIVCEDQVAFRKEEDISKLQQYMQDKVLPTLTNFEWVYIIGWSGETYIPFEQS